MPRGGAAAANARWNSPTRPRAAAASASDAPGGSRGGDDFETLGAIDSSPSKASDDSDNPRESESHLARGWWRQCVVSRVQRLSACVFRLNTLYSN